MQNVLADIIKICRFLYKTCRYFVVFLTRCDAFSACPYDHFPAVYPVPLPQAVVRLAWLRCRSSVSLILPACVIRVATWPASDRRRQCPGSCRPPPGSCRQPVAMAPESWLFPARRGGILSACLIDYPPGILASSLRPSKLRHFRGLRGCPGQSSTCTRSPPSESKFRGLVWFWLPWSIYPVEARHRIRIHPAAPRKVPGACRPWVRQSGHYRRAVM